MTAPIIREVVEVLGETLKIQGADAPAALSEQFDRLMGLIRYEDKGWTQVFGGNADADSQFGIPLAGLKAWDRKIVESVYGAPWIGRGFRLRHSYVWKDGIRYGNVPKQGTRGKRNIDDAINSDGNQENFFGDEARRMRELSLYSAGIAFWIGNDRTKELTAIPLRQITDQLLEPNGLGYVIAYKREWSEMDIETGEVTPQKRWYMTDRYGSKARPAEILTRKSDATADEKTPVDTQHTIFDQVANRARGYVYGAPDALAAYIWNEIARDAVMDGRAMTQALAAFALKATTKSKKGGDNAALELATASGAGDTAILGAANDLVPLSSAGKGYDFGSLLALISIVATALDVPVIHLTANPGDAGASYGAASTMDLPTRLAMEARRNEHVAFDKRVLRWMGLERPEVFFIPFDKGEEIYRSIQALMLEFGADILGRQELRDLVDDLHGRPNGTVPTEDKRPSVLAAKAMAKAVPKPEPTAPAAAGDTPKQAASPTQGRSNGTGGQSGAANDIRRGSDAPQKDRAA